MPKVTKKLQRKSPVFVQQVQALSFPKVMAAPCERNLSSGKRLWPPRRTAEVARSAPGLRAGFQGAAPQLEESVCARRVWKGQAWVGVNAPLPFPRAPPAAPGGAARGVGTDGTRLGAREPEP